MRRVAVAVLAAAIVACGGSSPEPPQARFVHAFTPNVAGTQAAPAGAPLPPDNKALSDVLAWVRTAPPEGPGADFVVLTGDFGISQVATPSTTETSKPAAAGSTGKPASNGTSSPGQEAPAGGTPQGGPGTTPSTSPPQTQPTPNTAPSTTAPALNEADAKIADRIFASLRSAPPDLTIYVVPGSTTVARGGVADELRRAQAILRTVAGRLEPASVFLRDLSACYTNTAASCARRIPGTTLRLVGYPGYVARSRNEDGTFAVATAPTVTTQTEWVRQFETVVAAAEPGIRTFVVSPLSEPLAAYWASDDLATNFAKAALPNTAGGLAILGSSATRTAYEPKTGFATPEGTTGQATRLLDVQRRMTLAPPLVFRTAAANGQPQGVTVLELTRLGITSRVHWYDPAAAPFTHGGAQTEAPVIESRGSRTGGLVQALLDLPYLGSPTLSALARWVLLAVAFVAAFLTVVAIWNIPPPAPTDLAPHSTTAAAGASQTTTTTTTATATQTTQQTTTADQLRETFLGTRLARTVVSGFAGLAAVKLATNTTLFNNADAEASGYYLVWFVMFFMGLLLASAFARGWLETWRAAIFLRAQPELVNVGESQTRKSRKAVLRVYLLTFGDAFLNVLQGKNQMQSALWGAAIVNLQEDIVLAADRIRESIRSAVIELLPQGPPMPQANEIRVAISVLSEDETRVYYISWPADSLNREFGTKSVAWIVVAGGRARWWKKNKAKTGGGLLYSDPLQIISAADGVPGVQGPQKLSDYFENRDQDYDAFIVLPVPFRRRGDANRRGRGGIHISFKNESYMDALFDTSGGFTLDDDANPYAVAGQLLDKAKPPLNGVLNQGIKVLSELLRDFNEAVYMRDIRPKRRI